MRQLIMLLAAGLLVGCATLAEGDAGTELVVKYAALKTCDTPERATRCIEIATEVKRYANDTEYLTVSALMAAITDEIDWQGLDPADTLLVQALLDRLQTGLIDYLGPDHLPEDLQLATATVADWVVAAASLIE